MNRAGWRRWSKRVFLAAGLLAAAQALGAGEDPGGLMLTGAGAGITQTSDTAWTLEKTGSVSGSTVTWNITATEGATVAGRLVVSGQMTVTNSGSGPATIGNIVVNLQTRVGNTWKTASSDVADATSGDAATTANIFNQASSENLSSFSENSASGSLEFMDATNNTVFSLVPEVTIPAGGTKSLLFQATFDNNVLNLAPGTSIRSETIISFGNATTSNASAPNIDINGNGIIDSDEARVRSVPSRLTLTVPAQTNGAANPTLSDTLSDITATGTVSFSNVVINLGATSGTVTATVDGGTDGGKITNCAHLTDPGIQVTSGGFTFWQVEPLDLESCDTQDVGGTPTCTPGAPGCGWSQGDETSYTQFQWDSAAAAAPLLVANFDSLYGGIFSVGIVGPSTFSMTFSSAGSLLLYLPAFGTAAPLTSDLVDPTSSSSGGFGADVVALKLNVDFSDNALIPSSSTAFGNLLLCNVTPAGLNGSNVRALLAAANTLMSGSSSPYSIVEIAALVNNVDNAFVGGTPSTFAQEHLFVGSCPP